MSEWIAIEERMPDKGEHVLVFGKNGRNYARVDSHSRDSGLFFWDSHSEHIRGVTHWMPFPELPGRRPGES